jgi:hypothetical protein
MVGPYRHRTATRGWGASGHSAQISQSMAYRRRHLEREHQTAAARTPRACQAVGFCLSETTNRKAHFAAGRRRLAEGLKTTHPGKKAMLYHPLAHLSLSLRSLDDTLCPTPPPSRTPPPKHAGCQSVLALALLLSLTTRIHGPTITGPRTPHVRFGMHLHACRTQHPSPCTLGVRHVKQTVSLAPFSLVG